MSGWSKALSLSLALIALSLFTASCSSNSNTQVRLINAIPDGQPIDVYINGTPIVTNLAFGAIQPDSNPARYIPAPAGTNESLESFPRGATTNPIPPTGTVSLNGSTQYTVIGVGLELNEAPPLVLVDNNLPPVSGNVEFRVVNVSPSSPVTGLDVYIVAPGTDIALYSPQISALTNGQSSNYQSLPFLSGGYSVIITANGQKTPLITQPLPAPSGSITTLVILDNAGGNNGMSTTPLVLQDVQ